MTYMSKLVPTAALNLDAIMPQLEARNPGFNQNYFLAKRQQLPPGELLAESSLLCDNYA